VTCDHSSRTRLLRTEEEIRAVGVAAAAKLPPLTEEQVNALVVILAPPAPGWPGNKRAAG
jgi:hypothetical protein